MGLQRTVHAGGTISGDLLQWGLAGIRQAVRSAGLAASHLPGPKTTVVHVLDHLLPRVPNSQAQPPNTIEHHFRSTVAGVAVAEEIEFYFDPICPWAYQTSVWIRRVREVRGFDISWRFFSLEEINRPDGKRHPWERPLAYGWTPMRVGAWLRRHDMAWCDAWYEAAGRALHVEGRRPYDQSVAEDLLQQIGAPRSAWQEALDDPTTHDDVRADHDHAVERFGAFGVPVIVPANGRAIFGPVMLPAPEGDQALALWDLALAASEFPGLFELKFPKTRDDMNLIASTFMPYLSAREWQTIQNPAP